MIAPRALAVLLHRWSGWLLLVPLTLAAITGSVLVFHAELQRGLNPQRYVTPRAQAPLDIGQLARRAQADLPQMRILAVHALGNDGSTYVVVEPLHQGGPSTGFDRVYLDPYTGAALDREQAGTLGPAGRGVMGFVYKFHHTLLLGHTGLLLMGIAAVLWTLDNFVGLWLTMPRARNWARAWRVRWSGSNFRRIFDLHRAGALWLWALLMVFAWSSVYMNLWDSVYTPVTRLVSEYHAPWTDLPPRPVPPEGPALGWQAAHAKARSAMAAVALSEHLRVEREVQMKLDRARNAYLYRVRSSLDFQDRRGRTDVLVDATDGRVLMTLLPREQYAGNTFTHWLYALHMGNVLGTGYRLVVCLLGVLITGLAVSGVLIWWRKRRARKS